MSALPAIPIKAEKARFFPSRQAWQESREQQRNAEKYEIGGSMIAMILGLKPFGRTQWDAYVSLSPHYDKPQRTEREQEFLNRGIEWEPIAVDKYRKHTGNLVIDDKWDHWIEDLCIEEQPAGDQVLQIVGPEEWMVVTPDCLVANDSDGWGGGEGKTSVWSSGWGESGAVIEEWKPECAEILPPIYACQCYWYLAATGLPYWDLFVLLSRAGDFPELRTYRLLNHEPTVSEIVEKVSEWRWKHLVEGEPPEIDESEAARQWLLRRYPGPAKGQKTIRDADPEEIAMIADYKYWKNAEAEAKARKEDIRNQLTMHIGDDYGLQYGPGKKKALWFPSKGRGGLDLKRLQEQYPEAYEDCFVPGEPTRVFRVFG